MTPQRTPSFPHMTERQKARVRPFLLTLIAIIGPPLAGVRSVSVWVVYFIFVALYSMWSLRLSRSFSSDRRLGYVLSFTDAAILLPLLTWSSGAAMKTLLLLVCGIGVSITLWADRARTGKERKEPSGAHVGASWPQTGRPAAFDPESRLELAVRLRLRVLNASGTRFALVVLRVLRLEEMASYYGEDLSERILSAVGRRGLRLLGPDAQHFPLKRGRVAFLFEMESARQTEREVEGAVGGVPRWGDPYDVEGLAMTIGRKACDHLIDGHKIECVVGWASAPADGLSPDDLLYIAESGAQSAAAFRRVASAPVPVSERARAAAG